MIRALLSLTVLTVLATSAPVAAQEGSPLTGAWTLSFTSSQGSVSLPLELRQEGTVLRGTSGSALGYRTDFDEGRVDGTSFAFDVFVEVEGDWYPLIFSGRVEDDELTGNVDIPDGTRATFRGVRTPSG
jgi:hypothetical protein